jgi:hypothetical protein
MTGNEYDPFVGKRAKPRVKTLIQDCKNNTIKGWPVCEYASAKEVGPMKDSIKLKNCQTIYDGIVKFCRTLEGKTFYVPNELADHLYWGGLSVKQINEFVFSSTNFTKVTINAFVGEKPNSHWNRDGRSLNINMSIDDGKKDRVEILLLREIIGRAWNQKTSDHTGEVQNTYIETYKVFTEILKKYFFTSL